MGSSGWYVTQCTSQQAVSAGHPFLQALEEDRGPWIKSQPSLSPQLLLFCLQMRSNGSDKNSLQSLTKILISQSFAKPCSMSAVLRLFPLTQC